MAGQAYLLDIIPAAVFFLTAFGVTFVTLPAFISRMHARNLLVRDYYKPRKPKTVATMGGLPMLAGVLGALIIAQPLLVADIFSPMGNQKVLMYYILVFSFAAFGLTDDLLNVGRTIKIVVPFVLALPIALLNLDTTVTIPLLGEVELGMAYHLLVAPMYVMVVANLINMHSGFNGLASGLSLILFSTVAVRAYLMHRMVSYFLPVIGVLTAFFWYNRYPSKIFFGNSGSMMVGSALGAALVFNNMEIFGMFILTPHIVNFLLYVAWLLKGTPIIKWGRIRRDGTLEVPNPLTLKWVLPYYFPLTEVQATWAMWLLTGAFCLGGLLWL